MGKLRAKHVYLIALAVVLITCAICYPMWKADAARDRARAEIRQHVVALKVASTEITLGNPSALAFLQTLKLNLLTAAEFNRRHFEPGRLAKVNQLLTISQREWQESQFTKLEALLKSLHAELEILDAELLSK